jgi:hypothetical protein
MRRALPFLCALALTVAAVAGDSGRPPSAAPRPAEAPALQYQGVASCAAAACHNGNGPRGSKGSEYTTWMAHDPHSRAHSVLSEPRSRVIVKNYRQLKTAQEARPDRDELCLSCHVQPGLAGLNRHERFSAADGVGCEACHGPAEKWLDRHYRDEWKGLDAAAKQALGMTDTKNVLARAEACVGCHVGKGEADVNHDLIAAGHPRLRFEYSAYLARYPRHWQVADDRRRHPDFEARAWEVGQFVSAVAALELLHDRATRPDAPWPEFAEHDCAACHHDLQEPSDRQQRGFAGRRPGSPPWGTWYYPLLPTIARTRAGGGAEALAALADVNKLMAHTTPDRERAASAARRAADALRPWSAERDRVGADEKRLGGLLTGLAGQDDVARAGWDGAAQVYLGLAALRQARKNLGTDEPALAEPLGELRRQLEEAFPRGRESVYDSPSRFDPDAVQRRLRSLRERLK